MASTHVKRGDLLCALAKPACLAGLMSRFAHAGVLGSLPDGWAETIPCRQSFLEWETPNLRCEHRADMGFRRFLGVCAAFVGMLGFARVSFPLLEGVKTVLKACTAAPAALTTPALQHIFRLAAFWLPRFSSARRRQGRIQ